MLISRFLHGATVLAEPVREYRMRRIRGWSTPRDIRRRTRAASYARPRRDGQPPPLHGLGARGRAMVMPCEGHTRKRILPCTDTWDKRSRRRCLRLHRRSASTVRRKRDPRTRDGRQMAAPRPIGGRSSSRIPHGISTAAECAPICLSPTSAKLPTESDLRRDEEMRNLRALFSSCYSSVAYERACNDM